MRTRRTTATTVAIEPLETRRLLAASAAVAPPPVLGDDGILTVTGTRGDDVITLETPRASVCRLPAGSSSP